jgi:hypothetical protein
LLMISVFVIKFLNDGFFRLLIISYFTGIIKQHSGLVVGPILFGQIASCVSIYSGDFYENFFFSSGATDPSGPGPPHY